MTSAAWRPGTRAVLGRRTVLGLALLGPLTACTSGGGARPAPAPPPDPDVALRAAAVAREQDLLALYDRAVAASPGRAALLLGLRAEHAAHLAALVPTPATSGAPPATPPPSTPPPSTPPPSTPPAGPVDLPAAEAAASAAHAAAVVPASRGLAALLASLAAAEAAHAVALA